MDGESGYDGGSEHSPPSSDISLSVDPRPCEICGSNQNQNQIMTCFQCNDTREHIYCARTSLPSVPHIWLCEECRDSSSVIQLVAPNRNTSIHDQSATSSRRTNQPLVSVTEQVDITGIDSCDDQFSATHHQTSHSHTSPVLFEESSATHVPMDTSPVTILKLTEPDAPSSDSDIPGPMLFPPDVIVTVQMPTESDVPSSDPDSPGPSDSESAV